MATKAEKKAQDERRDKVIVSKVRAGRRIETTMRNVEDGTERRAARP